MLSKQLGTERLLACARDTALQPRWIGHLLRVHDVGRSGLFQHDAGQDVGLGVQYREATVHRSFQDAGGGVDAAVHGPEALGVPATPDLLCANATVPAGRNRVPAGQLDAAMGIEAAHDRDAVRAWIAARVGSKHTAKQYEREAERFMLWCLVERHKALSDANAQDCGAYMDFLANIPDAWISRAHKARLEPGWAPFKGQLTLASRKVAVAALHSLFSWLVAARYLATNPWVLVNRKLGDDPQAQGDEPTSRAFTPGAWAALHSSLDAAAPSGAVSRMRWLCRFVEGTGLRPSELVAARRGHLQRVGEAWQLKVHGKGRKNRLVPVPSGALEATHEYFESRGLTLESAPAEAPLLASLADSMTPIGYGSLHKAFTRFVRKAVAGASMSDRSIVERASAHWLRHTHATRAAERGVPLDVLQENLGQSDPRTTARYYRAQIERRRAAMEKAFGQPAPAAADHARGL